MSMYKDRDCFFIYSSFLAGKEAKEAGGTYEWFPLDPLSTFDRGSAPLGRPRSRGRVSTSGRVLQERHRASDVPPPRWGRDSCEQSFRFWQDFRGRMYYRRCGAKVELFNTARAESERRRKTEEATRGRENENKKRWAGKGSGHGPPTVALPKRSVGGVAFLVKLLVRG